MLALKKAEQALRLVKEIGGVVRPKDLAGHGIAPVYLRRLFQNAFIRVHSWLVMVVFIRG